MGLDLSFLLHRLSFSTLRWLRFYQEHVEHHVLLIVFLSTLQICVGAALHGLGMSACFIATLTLMTESGGKSVTVDQVSLKLSS